MNLNEISKILKADIKGDTSIEVEGIKEIDKATEKDITFLTNQKYKKLIKITKARVILTGENTVIDEKDKTFLIVKNPSWAVAKLIDIFYPVKKPEPKISKYADINKTSKIGENVFIDSFVKIEDGVEIGNNVSIYSNVYIGKNTVLGDNTIIYPNVTIRENIRIGKNVIIHSGTVIGSDGFGYYKENGYYYKIPQRGGVIIEDEVEIGSNVSIDRATIGNTYIGYGTKIDNLVQIAHNVRIGKCCIIVAQTGIAGSTKIGDNTTIAGQAGIAGHLNIGNNVIIGGQSGVISDIPDGKIVSGYPAREHSLSNKAYALLYKLPEIVKEIKILKQKIKGGENESMGRP